MAWSEWKKFGVGVDDIIVLGTYETDSDKNVDCTHIPNYDKLTVDNFVYDDLTIKLYPYANTGASNKSDSYNPSTGIYTIGKKSNTVIGADPYYHSSVMSVRLKCIPYI